MSATSDQLANWVAVLDNAATWKSGAVGARFTSLAATINGTTNPADLVIASWAETLLGLQGNFTGTRYDTLVEIYIDMETSAGDLATNVLDIANALVTAGLRLGLAQVIAEQILNNTTGGMSGVSTFGVGNQTGHAQVTLDDITAVATPAELGCDPSGAATAALGAAKTYSDGRLDDVIPDPSSQPDNYVLTVISGQAQWLPSAGPPTGATPIVFDGGTPTTPGATIFDGGSPSTPGALLLDGGVVT